MTLLSIIHSKLKKIGIVNYDDEIFSQEELDQYVVTCHNRKNLNRNLNLEFKQFLLLYKKFPDPKHDSVITCFIYIYEHYDLEIPIELVKNYLFEFSTIESIGDPSFSYVFLLKYLIRNATYTDKDVFIELVSRINSKIKYLCEIGILKLCSDDKNIHSKIYDIMLDRDNDAVAVLKSVSELELLPKEDFGNLIQNLDFQLHEKMKTDWVDSTQRNISN